MERNASLLKASPIRLRPILITTAAMLLGMLPIALGLVAGGSQRAPMALTVIGGWKITSTLLISVLVPVVYTLRDDLTRVSTQEPVPVRTVKDTQMSSVFGVFHGFFLAPD